MVLCWQERGEERENLEERDRWVYFNGGSEGERGNWEERKVAEGKRRKREDKMGGLSLQERGRKIERERERDIKRKREGVRGTSGEQKMQSEKGAVMTGKGH